MTYNITARDSDEVFQRLKLQHQALREAHQAETGCSRRNPCRDCDEKMRRIWYGDAYSDEDEDDDE